MSIAAPPRVSVVMPVYNTARYVGAAIASIVAQTFAAWELIVVDDGSTDRSGAIVDRWARRERRIRVVHQANAGISEARNAGLALARGPLLASMDSDDVCLPPRLARQVEFMESDAGHAVVGAAVERVDAFGLRLSVERPTIGHDAILSELLRGNGGVIRQPVAMLRTGQLREIGGYRPAYSATEDLDVYLRLCDHGRLANLPDVLLKYRQHASSVTWSKRVRQRDNAIAIVREAAVRWGLDLAGLPEIEPYAAAGRADVEAMFAEEARHAGHRLAAAIHAVRAIGHRPGRRRYWGILARSLLGRSRAMPASLG